ncbi:MAG: hypothetical protein ACI80K_002447 [Paracoccaceae bacterium]|jgi:hypothetical protein
MTRATRAQRPANRPRETGRFFSFDRGRLEARLGGATVSRMSPLYPRFVSAASWCALPLLLAACAAPPAGRLDSLEVATSLLARTEPSVLDEALEGLALPASFMRLPVDAERATPAQAGYWFVRALAWSPEVRAARRELSAAAATAKSAGAPNPIAIQAVDHELGGDDKLVEAIGVLDLIGLLGLGPSRAERGVASAETLLAAGRLERVAFDAWITVERARIGVVAARLRVERLAELVEAGQVDLERVRILEENDRLSEADAALARAEVARIERRGHLAVAELGGARRQLALAAGSLSGSLSGSPDGAGEFDAAVQAVGLGGLGEVADVSVMARASALPTDMNLAALAESHPALREARLVFDVREAEVREAASRAWPGVALGPHLGYLDQAQVGAVLRLAIPFPSSWKGRLEAAVERRDRAVERFEEILVDLLARQADALGRIAQMRATVTDEDGATKRAMEPGFQDWTAARARFRTGRGDLAGWTRALNRLAEMVTWPIDDVEALVLAKLDWTAASGPGMSPFAPPPTLYNDDADTTDPESQP